MILISKGFYFQDPAVPSVPTPLWKLIAPAVVIVMSYVLSLGVIPPQEPRNCRILPPELKEIGKREKWKDTIEGTQRVREPVGAL